MRIFVLDLGPAVHATMRGQPRNIPRTKFGDEVVSFCGVETGAAIGVSVASALLERLEAEIESDIRQEKSRNWTTFAKN